MLFNIASVEAISKILTNPTWDILVLFFFLALGFFYGITAGIKRLLSMLFAIYVSILLFINFKYLDFFVEGKSILEVFFFRLVIFLILIVLLCIIFNKIVFSELDKNKKWTRAIILSLLLSFLEIGLLISAVFQFLPAKGLFSFSPIVEKFFASEETFFWWLALPLIALFSIIVNQPKKKINRP